jgi:hypothetical protein
MSIRLWSSTNKKKRKFFVLKAALLTVMLSTSMGQKAFAQNANWTNDFIGELTFSLMDDPTYSTDYTSMNALSQELMRMRGLLNEKRQHLEGSNELRVQKNDQSESTLFSIEQKNDLADKTELELNALDNQLLAIDATIFGNEQQIIVKTNEKRALDQSIEDERVEFDKYTASVIAKQNLYDSLLADCQAANPTIDCTENIDVVFAAEMLEKTKDALTNVENKITTFVDLANAAQAVIDDKTSENVAQSQLKTQTETSISTKTDLVSSLRAQIPQLLQLASKLNAEISELDTLITVLIRDEAQLSDAEAVNALNFERADAQFKRIEQELITAILGQNKAGLSQAQMDGGNQGLTSAQELGDSRGKTDGGTDGDNEGETSGRDRDFQLGAATGETEGASDGRVAGTEEGTRAGSIEGNRIAGGRIGQQEGIQRAQGSNASRVGTTEGKISGENNARFDGESAGRTKGEKQAIDSNENIQLNATSANGSFAGTFAKVIPAFPGASDLYFNNSLQNDRVILRMAYASAYNVSFNSAVETGFNSNISSIYNLAYDSSYGVRYNTAMSVTYPDSIRQGRDTQYQAAYDREYGFSSASAHNISRDDRTSNPNRQSATFINARKVSEANSYASKYAEIKKKSFDQAAIVAYNENISGQTDKYREIRVGEVNKIYTNFPIIKFEGSSIAGRGQNGVGDRDGVYQPGENVTMDIVITNYGKKAATNVKVVTSSGKTIVLPSISGQSTVTVRGATNDRLSKNAKIGSTQKYKTTTTMKLTSTEKNIQGRHFESSSTGIVNSSNNKSVTINNPFSVEGISLADAVVLKKSNNISVAVKNNSTRAYVGPIKVEITSSLGASTLQSAPSSISSVARRSVETATGATLLVSDSRDIFSEVSFSIKVTKNGVVLAQKKNLGNTIVQMPYESKPGAPVIAVSSSSRDSRELFKDLANELGGAGQVSVLDLNNNEANQRLLGKLASKTVYILGSSSGQVASQMNQLFAGKGNLGVVIEDLSSTGTTSKVLKNKNLRKSSQMNFRIANKDVKVITSNKHANGKVTDRVSILSSRINQVQSLKEVGELLKLNNVQLIKAAADSVSYDSLINRDKRALGVSQTIIARVIEEIAMIDSMCLSRKDCKGLKSTIKTDQDLLINQLVELAKQGGDEAKGITLIADAVEKAVNSYAQKKTVRYLSIRKSFKKRAKALRKASAKQAKKSAGKKGVKALAKSAAIIIPLKGYSQK